MSDNTEVTLEAREPIDLHDYACCKHSRGLSIHCPDCPGGVHRILPSGEDFVEHVVRRAESRLINFIASIEGKELNQRGLVRELRQGAYR